MADGARVQDINTIRAFRAALVKFMEAGNAALSDAESELVRRQSWVDVEQTNYWQHNIRKLQELIGQLKEAIRMKKLFKDSSGRTPSAFDEEKKLRAAMARMEIAEQKLRNCRRWAKELQREHLMYRGGVQRLQTTLSSDLVNGVATLDRAVAQIEMYLSAGAPELAGSDTSGLASSDAVTEGAGQMKRSADAGRPAVETGQPAEAEPMTGTADPAAPAEGR